MWKGKVDRGFAEHVLKSGSDWLADTRHRVISISLQIWSTWVCFHLVLLRVQITVSSDTLAVG